MVKQKYENSVVCHQFKQLGRHCKILEMLATLLYIHNVATYI